jgi:RNA polymerase sigma factor (sigma-70 family)
MRQGSDRAVELLWKHYQRPLRAVLKRRLLGVQSRAMDEEDVAITAFHSFLRRARGGEYPDVESRDEVWRLLVMIAMRKALNYSRHEGRMRRNTWRNVPHPTRPESNDFDAIDRSPPPDVAVMVIDSLEHVLSTLNSDELREIAVAKLAGFSNAEIARAVGRSQATIERRLRLIRARWQQEIDE